MDENEMQFCPLILSYFQKRKEKCWADSKRICSNYGNDAIAESTAGGNENRLFTTIWSEKNPWKNEMNYC